MDCKEEPVLKRYVDLEDNSHDPGYSAYHLGRLVALLISMKYQAHRGDFSDNIAIALYSRASACPASFCKEGMRQFLVISTKLRKSHVGNHLLDIWNLDVWPRIQGVMTQRIQQLSLSQAGELARGYQQQMGYNVHLAKYQRTLHEKESDKAAE